MSRGQFPPGEAATNTRRWQCKTCRCYYQNGGHCPTCSSFSFDGRPKVTDNLSDEDELLRRLREVHGEPRLDLAY